LKGFFIEIFSPFFAAKFPANFPADAKTLRDRFSLFWTISVSEETI
jgi:hypothetical protein